MDVWINRRVIGCDPGGTGGLVVLDDGVFIAEYKYKSLGSLCTVDKIKYLTEQKKFLDIYAPSATIIIECVHGQQGSSTKAVFSFGGNVYSQETLLLMYPTATYYWLSPQAWQNGLKKEYPNLLNSSTANAVLSAEQAKAKHKDELWMISKSWFPDRKVTKRMADAYLIAAIPFKLKTVFEGKLIRTERTIDKGKK